MGLAYLSSVWTSDVSIQLALSSSSSCGLLQSTSGRFIVRDRQSFLAFSKVSKSCFRLFIFHSVFSPLCSSWQVIGGLFISVYSSRIKAQSEGIRLSLSILYNLSGSNFIVVKAKLIIKPLFLLFGFVITSYLLFRIKLYFLIIFFSGSASFLCVKSGFYIRL